MKLLPSLLVVALTTWSCVLTLAESSPKIDNTGDEERQLRQTRPKKNRKIKPIGTPKAVRDANGKVKRRKSIIDLSEMMLGDGEDNVDIQLMSDEAPQTLKMKRGSNKVGSYESWYGMDATTGNQLTMVKTKTPWGDTVTTGSMHGNNGTVYQIRTLADGNVVAEEVKQGMFDQELEAVRSDATINAIDMLPEGGRRGRRALRRLDSPSVLDIMVSPENLQVTAAVVSLMTSVLMYCVSL